MVYKKISLLGGRISEIKMRKCGIGGWKHLLTEQATDVSQRISASTEQGNCHWRASTYSLKRVTDISQQLSVSIVRNNCQSPGTETSGSPMRLSRWVDNMFVIACTCVLFWNKSDRSSSISGYRHISSCLRVISCPLGVVHAIALIHGRTNSISVFHIHCIGKTSLLNMFTRGFNSHKYSEYFMIFLGVQLVWWPCSWVNVFINA